MAPSLYDQQETLPRRGKSEEQNVCLDEGTRIFLIFPMKSALFVDLFYSWVLQSFNLAQLGIGHVRVLGSQMKTILKVGLAMKS